MTPLYLDSQEAVDRHNERVKVQREAFNKGMLAAGWETNDAAKEWAAKAYPFAELRPPGFVGGSGRRYDYHAEGLVMAYLNGLIDGHMTVPASDRAAASAALTGGVMVWCQALCSVAERHNCLLGVAAQKYQSEVIAEAQAILDRESAK